MSDERRVNRGLREILDELVEHVRYVARNVEGMSKRDLEYAEERLEWLADEVWRAATDSEKPRPYLVAPLRRANSWVRALLIRYCCGRLTRFDTA